MCDIWLFLRSGLVEIGRGMRYMASLEIGIGDRLLLFDYSGHRGWWRSDVINGLLEIGVGGGLQHIWRFFEAVNEWLPKAVKDWLPFAGLWLIRYLE